MQSFETARLLVRPLTEDDLDALYELYRRPELMQYITGQPRSYATTRQRLRDHMGEHVDYGFGLCATIDKRTGTVIGRAGLEPIVRTGGLEANIAWMFLPAYWNRGLATEFAVAMLDVGFAELGITRVVATADTRNKASIRVMEKAGMHFVHVDRRGVLYEALPTHPERLPHATRALHRVD